MYLPWAPPFDTLVEQRSAVVSKRLSVGTASLVRITGNTSKSELHYSCVVLPSCDMSLSQHVSQPRASLGRRRAFECINAKIERVGCENEHTSLAWLYVSMLVTVCPADRTPISAIRKYPLHGYLLISAWEQRGGRDEISDHGSKLRAKLCPTTWGRRASPSLQ